MSTVINRLYQKSVQMRAFWWRRRDGIPNAGDELARSVVEFALRTRDISIFNNGLIGHSRLMSIGSVLHFSKDGDCVWGAGINGKIPKTHYKFSSLDVRATRGPRTRDVLKSMGISSPNVYGDPGLLAPFVYPSISTEQDLDVVYIPHMNDAEVVPEGDFDGRMISVCSPLQQPSTFIGHLRRARKVVSRSLHGVILAESYNIPAVWLAGSGEPDFKYLDYFEGTGRFNIKAARTLKEGLQFSEYPLMDLHAIQERLLSCFPYDLWLD